MLPLLLLAPVALASPFAQAPAQPTAKPAKAVAKVAPKPAGPSVEGWVLNAKGKPLQATVGLLPAAKRGNPMADKTVESLGQPNRKRPGFRLPLPEPGVYLLDVRAKGHHRLLVPVRIGAEPLTGLEFAPRPEKPVGEVGPISPDAKLARMEAIYGAMKGRQETFRNALKAANNKLKDLPADLWTADLDTLAKELSTETDADAAALLAVATLELGGLYAKVTPETAALALEKLPASSPFWSLAPQMPSTAFALAQKSKDFPAFREALVAENPDREVKAAAIFSQLAAAARSENLEQQKALFQTLTTEYKDSPAARAAKQFDPDKILRKGQAFPGFTVKSLEGQDLTLESFKGKVVLVDFWATWCPPCVAEMPEITAVYEKFKASGFDILSLSLDAKVEDIAPFRAEKFPMPWNHTFLGRGKAHPLIETLNVNSIPRPILVGPDGTVIEPDGNKLRGKLLGLSVEAALKAVGLLKAPEAPKADPATEAPKTETTTEANQG